MSEYIMDAGSRLEIGPGGRPYEQFGACCAGCAKSGGSCGGGGALGQLASKGAMMSPERLAAITQIAPSTNSGSSSTSRMPLYLAAAGVAAVGLFLLLRRRGPRRNPSTFTRKGERMYRHIRAGYGSDPRAKEIAARTVYAAAKRGTPGLTRKRRR